jgi:hypothetical protein
MKRRRKNKRKELMIPVQKKIGNKNGPNPQT